MTNTLTSTIYRLTIQLALLAKKEPVGITTTKPPAGIVHKALINYNSFDIGIRNPVYDIVCQDFLEPLIEIQQNIVYNQIDSLSFIKAVGHELDQETLKLLSFVDSKVLSMLAKIDYSKYDICQSHGYFSITDADTDETILASPYITSPIIFNPNDPEVNGSYTISNFVLSYSSKRVVNSTNVYKKNDPAAGIHFNTPNTVTIRQVANSLLDYYSLTMSPSGVRQFQSVYQKEQPQRVTLGIKSYSNQHIRPLIMCKYN